MRSLCVEGWRFLHHSYAVVNQWQLLSLLKRNDLSLSVRDVPYIHPEWTARKGLFGPEQEKQLEIHPHTCSERNCGCYVEDVVPVRLLLDA